MFVDLVKAYDTVNHKMLIEILQQYGAPEKFTNVIERNYSDLKVKLQIGSEKQEIPQTVGVRRGDPLSPVLFLFIISVVSEVLKTEFAKAKIPCVTYRKVEEEEIINEGQLISHAPRTQNGGETFAIIDLFFVDDGAFPFPTREAMVGGAPIVDEILKKFDLLMHVGATLENGEEIRAKTECVFYPPPGFLDTITIQPELDPTNQCPRSNAEERIPCSDRKKKEVSLLQIRGNKQNTHTDSWLHRLHRHLQIPRNFNQF
jgi:hypothetical protein